jgi:hypothetical protein
VPLNEQFSVTLDAYHKWAVERIVKVMRTSRSDLVLWAVRDWVANHSQQVSDARATLADFSKSPKRGPRK